MAGTGKKGYTGTTSSGQVISNGIVQNGGTSSTGPGGASASLSNVRVSEERESNGQPSYVYTSSGKAVPTYGYRVVQGGKDGQLYDIQNGVARPINGGSISSVGGSGSSGSGGSSGGYGYYDDDDDDGGGGGSSRYRSSGGGGYNVVDPETQALRDKLKDLEANKPDAYANQYESQIKSILDTILNRKAFDINTDTNYRTLYDLYQQQYQNQASKAARDVLGQAAGLTGGYGSTYGQNVATQAYDNIMQGMNDNNINLMNLAYGMYQDDRANDYNKMSTLTGLEASDYAKWLDTMSNYYTDLNHFTNRFNTAWANDYRLNRDEIEDARYEDELAYAREQAELQRQLAQEALDYERAWNEDERDYSRSNDAYSRALSLVKAGYMPSESMTSGLPSDTVGLLGQIYSANAPVAAATSGGGSSGRSSGGSSSSASRARVGNSVADAKLAKAEQQTALKSAKTDTQTAYKKLINKLKSTM